ncbi:MAG: transporter [Verrucomicrobia bacterium]|nr:MAG: transporter [Verrucomicrobiota bacterium]
MNWFVSALITGAVAFSATNIDDIVFLTIFFSQTPHRWHVVFGQYVGFTALVLVSLLAFVGGQILPHEWLRLFGIAPIAIGIKKLITKRNVDVQGVSTGALDVATVTFVNGADNIGIYAPLFAISDAPRVLVLVAVLYVLLAVWCVISYLIHRQKAVAYTLRRWGHWIVPVVLIALGIYILLD